jgi:hypothetical protein
VPRSGVAGESFPGRRDESECPREQSSGRRAEIRRPKGGIASRGGASCLSSGARCPGYTEPMSSAPRGGLRACLGLVSDFILRASVWCSRGIVPRQKGRKHIFLCARGGRRKGGNRFAGRWRVPVVRGTMPRLHRTEGRQIRPQNQTQPIHPSRPEGSFHTFATCAPGVKHPSSVKILTQL